MSSSRPQNYALLLTVRSRILDARLVSALLSHEILLCTHQLRRGRVRTLVTDWPSRRHFSRCLPRDRCDTFRESVREDACHLRRHLSDSKHGDHTFKMPFCPVCRSYRVGVSKGICEHRELDVSRHVPCKAVRPWERTIPFILRRIHNFPSRCASSLADPHKQKRKV